MLIFYQTLYKLYISTYIDFTRANSVVINCMHIYETDTLHKYIYKLKTISILENYNIILCI